MKEQQPADIKELVEELNGRGERVIFLGDGVPPYQAVIEGLIKVPHRFAQLM